jgi:hypothetical protein
MIRPLPDTRRRRLLAAAVSAPVLVAAPGARAVEPMTQHDVVLIQPGAVLERRISQDVLAAWVTAIGNSAAASLRDHPRQIPTAGFIVVVAKPGGRARTWFDFKPALAKDTEAGLAQAMAALPVPPVQEGPVVASLRVSVWGAKPPAGHAPAPEEWKAAAKQAGRTLPIDELIQAVWPG